MFGNSENRKDSNLLSKLSNTMGTYRKSDLKNTYKTTLKSTIWDRDKDAEWN